MSDVWLLTRGEYDDFRVLGAIEASPRPEGEEAVRALVARLNEQPSNSYADPYEYERAPVIPLDVEKVQILRLKTELWNNGTETLAAPLYSFEWPFDADNVVGGVPECAWRWVRAPMYRGNGGRLEVWGTDGVQVHAVFHAVKQQLRADRELFMREEIVS